MFTSNSEFESSQIFSLHIFASGIFGYLLNGITTCIFDNVRFMNRNSEISCWFKVNGTLTLSSEQLKAATLLRLENQRMVFQIILCCFKEFCHFREVLKSIFWNPFQCLRVHS